MEFPSDEVLKELKHADAGLLAEEITGKHYKEDEETSKLMCGLHMMLGRARRDAFAAVDDTYHSIPFDEFLRIARGEGFKELARLPLKRLKYGKDEVEYEDERVFLFHSKGLYLNLDSYREGETTNGAYLTYSSVLDQELSEAMYHDMEVREDWEDANPNWYAIRDQAPHLLTREQHELWEQWYSAVRGNACFYWEKKQRIRLCLDRYVLQGFRLTVSELLKETCWEITPKLLGWEWGSNCFQSAPTIGWNLVEHTHEDGSTYTLSEHIRMPEEEWKELVFSSFPEEHQYLRDLPERDELNTYDDYRRAKKGLLPRG